MTLAAVIPTKHTRNPNDVLAPGVIRAMKDDGGVDPAHDPGISDAELVSLYTAMVRVRILDDRLVSLQRQGRIGFHIGSIGEEAAILGSAFAMRKRDWIFPCYREFGAALWRAFALQSYLDNMFGNANDAAKGRQMPDHYTARSAHFGSISSPVGPQITQAVGFPWAPERQPASASFAEKGSAYGVPSLRCDGNDLLAVISATKEALARAVRGDG